MGIEGTRVVGLRTDAGPLRDVAIQFGDGVTALYGLNGAGKSWILKALRECFRGRAQEGTHAVIRAAGWDPIADWDSVPGQDLGGSRARRSWRRESQNDIRQAVEEWLSRGGRYFQPQVDAGYEVTDGLVDEIVSSPYYALVPTGGNQARWDVWLCVSPDAVKTPTLYAEVERFRKVQGLTSDLADTIMAVNKLDRDDAEELAELTRKFGQLAGELMAVNPSSDEYSLLESAFSTLGSPPSEDGSPSWLEDAEQWHFAASGTDGCLNFSVAAWAWDQVWIRQSIEPDLQSWSSHYWIRRIIDDGLPFPIARLGEFAHIPFQLEDESDATDINELTSQRFTLEVIKQIPEDPKSIVVTPSMEEWVATLQTDANRILQGLLQDGPELRLELRQPFDWLTSSPLSWSYQRKLPHQPSRDPEHAGRTAVIEVPITGLSTAESRWASAAIRRALGRLPQDPELRRDLEKAFQGGYLLVPAYGSERPRQQWGLWVPDGAVRESANLVLFDEPEAALHRSAERHMARGLDSLTVGGPQIVVATHSPEILNRPEVSLVHVQRAESGASTANQMLEINPEKSLRELGLEASDLIGMYRAFLLVEGEHDEIVLRALLPDVLEAARVKIIAMRGGAKLPSTVESQVLFDMTSASIVAMLDNVAADDIETVWQEAQERFLTSGSNEAIEHLTTQLRNRKGDEYVWISTWLSRALKKGVNERLVPFGLAAADIIEYLPVEFLVPKANKQWAELRAEHEAAKPTLSRPKHDFKRWLAHAYKADLSTTKIRAAAESTTEVPEEIAKLGYRLRQITSA